MPSQWHVSSSGVSSLIQVGGASNGKDLTSSRNFAVTPCVLGVLFARFYCLLDVETRTFRQRPLPRQTSRSSRSSSETFPFITNISRRWMVM